MRKEIDQVFTALFLEWWNSGMALVTILLRFPFTRLHSRFIFINTVGQISLVCKSGN